MAEVDGDIKSVLDGHDEALVICLDNLPGGESTVQLLYKFDDKNDRLSKYLEELLSRLLSVGNAKRRRNSGDPSTGA